MSDFFHSVYLDEEKCRGCTNCIKRCPTEAIRVRKSKARIINEKCIDCGECIRVCPYHAKKAITDTLEVLLPFKYRVALPAPTLYGQFAQGVTREQILTSLRKIGFDHCFEVSRAAEIVSKATKEYFKSHTGVKPLISTACPAVVKLIAVRFPSLMDNLLRFTSPMECAAKLAKEEFAQSRGVSPEEIGVFFITPCAAKATSVKAPYEDEKSNVDGVISIKDIYIKLLNHLKSKDSEEWHELSGFEGIRWANPGGESLCTGSTNFIAVDGIHNIITILEAAENEKLEDVDFIEALSCSGGCLGGPLTVENPFLARKKINSIIDEAKAKGEANESLRGRDHEVSNLSHAAELREIPHPIRFIKVKEIPYQELIWNKSVHENEVLRLDNNIFEAAKKLRAMEIITSELPGLDCGACGAPNCKALAEDIVRGVANENDCVFKMREKVRNLALQMMELEAKMPPVMDKTK